MDGRVKPGHDEQKPGRPGKSDHRKQNGRLFADRPD